MEDLAAVLVVQVVAQEILEVVVEVPAATPEIPAAAVEVPTMGRLPLETGVRDRMGKYAFRNGKKKLPQQSRHTWGKTGAWAMTGS